MASKLFFLLAVLMVVAVMGSVSAKEDITKPPAAKAPAAADDIPEAGAVSPSGSTANDSAGGPIGETAVDGNATGVVGSPSDTPTGAPATAPPKSSASALKISATFSGAAVVAGSFLF